VFDQEFETVNVLTFHGAHQGGLPVLIGQVGISSGGEKKRIDVQITIAQAVHRGLPFPILGVGIGARGEEQSGDGRIVGEVETRATVPGEAVRGGAALQEQLDDGFAPLPSAARSRGVRPSLSGASTEAPASSKRRISSILFRAAK
jgi:hypothetical protein